MFSGTSCQPTYWMCRQQEHLLRNCADKFKVAPRAVQLFCFNSLRVFIAWNSWRVLIAWNVYSVLCITQQKYRQKIKPQKAISKTASLPPSTLQRRPSAQGPICCKQGLQLCSNHVKANMFIYTFDTKKKNLWYIFFFLFIYLFTE